MQQVVLPPSPNWYGAHVADLAPELGLYAYAAQNTIVVLNTRGKAVRTMLTGHANRVTAVAFAGGAVPGAATAGDDGAGGGEDDALPPLLVSAAADRSLRLWNAATMQRHRALYKRPAEVTALAVTSDGATALVGDKAGALWAWHLADPSSKPLQLTGCKQASPVSCLAAAPAGSATSLAGISSSSNVGVSSSNSGSDGGSSGSLVLAGYADGSVLLLDWRLNCVVRRLERHARDLHCVRWLAAPDPAAVAAAAAAAAAHRAAAQSAAAQSAADHNSAEDAASGGNAAEVLEEGACTSSSGGQQQQEQQEQQQQEEREPPSASTSQDEAPPPPSSPPHAAEQDQLAESPQPPQPEQPPLLTSDAEIEAPAALAGPGFPSPPPPAPPAWEVMLSCGADGTLRLYSVTCSPGAPSPSLTACSSTQLRLVATLHAPKPHAGMNSGQTSRLWFTAAVVPPLPPPLVQASIAAAGGELEAEQAQRARQAQQAQQHPEQHVWLVTSSHGGALLAWKVTLPPVSTQQVPLPLPVPPAAPRGSAQDSWRRSPAKAGPGAASAAAPLATVVGPCRLPIAHTRTVFTLHATAYMPTQPFTVQADTAASTSDSPSTTDANAAVSGGGESGVATGDAEQVVGEQAAAALDAAAAAEADVQAPVLQLLSSSMDRCVLLSELEHPTAAVQAVIAAAPAPSEGSWRRDSAASSAVEAVWKQAAVKWRVTGLGGYVYSFSLLVPPSPIAGEGRALQRAAEARQEEQAAPAGAVVAPSSEGGDEEAPPPPPPPPSPPSEPAAVNEMWAAGGKTVQEAPPQQVLQQNGVHHEEQEAEQAEHAAAQPLLLAVACGDRTIRVLPLAAAAAERRGGGRHRHQQLVLWQSIPDKVTAVAWQPLDSLSTAVQQQPQPQLDIAADIDAEATAPAADTASTVTATAAPGAVAAAAAAAAFGCENGSLGLMLPSRELALLLPVKHEGSVLDVRWAPPASVSGPAGQAAVQLYSLSADGTLLLWSPLPLPLSDLFSSAGRYSGGNSSAAAGAGNAGTTGGSWGAAGARLATALSSPLDVGTRLAAAAAAAVAEGLVAVPAEAAAWFGAELQQQRQALTALALPPNPSTAGSAGDAVKSEAGSPAAAAAAALVKGTGHLIAVAARNGAVAVLQVALAKAATAAEAAEGEVVLRMLWCRNGGGSGGSGLGSGNAISHLCFSSDGQQLASAAESGLLCIHPWTSQAALPTEQTTSSNAAAIEQGATATAARPAASGKVPTAPASLHLSSTVTALAWIDSNGSKSSSTVKDGSEGGLGNGSGGMVAAALASGGIQLIDYHFGPGIAGLVPTLLLWGHSGVVRCLQWLPSEQPEPKKAEELACATGGDRQPAAAELIAGPEVANQAGTQQNTAKEAEAQQEQLAKQEQQEEQQEAVPEHQQPQQQAEQHGEQQGEDQFPNLFLLSGAEDQSVRLWDIRRQLLTWQQRQPTVAATAAAASASAAKAAAGTGGAAVGVAASPVPEREAEVQQSEAVVEHPELLGGGEEAGREVLQEAASGELSAKQDGEAPAASAAAAAPATEEVVQSLPIPTQAGADAVPPLAGTSTPSGTEALSPALPVASHASLAVQATLPAQAAAPASSSSTAPADAAAGGKKKGASLGNRPVLPPSQIGSADQAAQQAAQAACLRMARQLLQAGQAQAGMMFDEAAEGSAPPPPPLPVPDPDAALLLDCSQDPLCASLALQRQAAALGAGAGTAHSVPSRLVAAQRGAAAALFRGDVAAAMQLLLDHDALTADFVSMSAAAGPAAWRAVTLAYAAKLEHHHQEPHLAALHLLAVQEVEEAVQVYQRAGLLREAVALASARLMPGNPVLLDLHVAYASQLSSKAQHEQAAAHLAAAGRWAAAAAALGARGTPTAAAAAVQMCRQALAAESGLGLGQTEVSKLQQRLAASERLLAELAGADGLDASALLAEAAVATSVPEEEALVPPPPPPDVPSSTHVATAAPGGAGDRGSSQARRRYSAQQLLAAKARVASSGGLPGLPEDLASGSGEQQLSGNSSNTPLQAGTSGVRRNGSSKAHCYSLQALLELSECADRLGPEEQQALRRALPAELLREEAHA